MGGGGEGGKPFDGCKMIRAPDPNQCQIITFLTLKTDSIAKLRIEAKGILLEIPSNKIKGAYIKLVHLWSSFYCFTKTLKENLGRLLGGGLKGMSPLQNYWEAWPSLPPHPLFLRLCVFNVQETYL